MSRLVSLLGAAYESDEEDGNVEDLPQTENEPEIDQVGGAHDNGEGVDPVPENAPIESDPSPLQPWQQRSPSQVDGMSRETLLAVESPRHPIPLSTPSQGGSPLPASAQDDPETQGPHEPVLEPGEGRVEHQWVPEIASFELLPEPEGECDPAVQAQVVNFLAKNQLGHSLNQNLVNLKSFRNPNIFTKLIEVFGIREYGSNIPNFDLYSLPAEASYEELWKAQKQWNEQRERERAKRTEISFVSPQQQQQQQQQLQQLRGPIGKAAGVARMLQSRMTGSIFSGTPVAAAPAAPAPAFPTTAGAQDTAAKKRRSKWDEVESNTSSRGGTPDADEASLKKQKTA